MESEQPKHNGIPLIEGEYVDSTLKLVPDGSEVVLLTNRRVVHINVVKGKTLASFASLLDINAINLTISPKGSGGLVWAAVAFVLAIALYATIDHSVARVVVSIVVLGLGVYLIGDHLMTRSWPLIIFTAGASQIRCAVKSREVPSDVYSFINQTFHLKEKIGSDMRKERYTFL